MTRQTWISLVALLASVLALGCAWWQAHPEAAAVASSALEQSDLVCALVTEDGREREVCTSAAALGRALLELEAAELAPVECPAPSSSPPPPAAPESTRVVPAGGAAP